MKNGPPVVFHHVLRVWKLSRPESSSGSLALKLSTLPFSSSQPGSMLRVSDPTRPSQRLTAQAVSVGPPSEQTYWGALAHDQLLVSHSLSIRFPTVSFSPTNLWASKYACRLDEFAVQPLGNSRRPGGSRGLPMRVTSLLWDKSITIWRELVTCEQALTFVLQTANRERTGARANPLYAAPG